MPAILEFRAVSPVFGTNVVHQPVAQKVQQLEIDLLAIQQALSRGVDALDEMRMLGAVCLI